MLFLYIFFIIVLFLCGVGFSQDDNYLSKERCNSIKGIFILMIFLTHSLQYLKASGYVFSGIDTITSAIIRFTGQLVVVMFLFYSGYGVAVQIKTKGKEYVRQMPRRRILKTLLNFDIAVCFFILLDVMISRPLSLSQVLLSFVAWDSVGNSNWYIFVIILCYTLTYLANEINNRNVWVIILLFCTISVFVLSYVKESWWYDTLLVYPAGYFFACYRHRIEPILKRYYVPILLVVICFFIVTHGYGPYLRGLNPNIMAISFALIVVMITMKVRIGNPVLQWFGINLFPLYIYQRLPMIALQNYLGDSFVSHNALFYLLSCLLITCVIAWSYKYWSI